MYDSSKSKLPSLAMTMCVRDEEDFVGANLAYHQALGVSRAYIFADRCKDSTIDIVKSFKWAEIIEVPSDHNKPFEIYHNRCADEALNMARRDGIEWLMFIDADEFAFAENTFFGFLGKVIPFINWFKRLPLLTRGDLRLLLKRVRSKTIQVILKPKEAIPLAFEKDKPFWSLHYFHTKGLENRRMLDPIEGDIKPVPWLGHTMGKSIVRTKANVQAAHSHRWTWNQEKSIPDVIPLPSQRKGYLYHFLFFNSDNWLEKFRKHSYFPKKFLRGHPINFPKNSWKIACPKMSEEEAKHYYRKWIAMPPDELADLVISGVVTKETTVEDVLLKSGWNKSAFSQKEQQIDLT